MTKTIGVIGAGAWGTALAQSLAAKDLDVRLWARESEVADSISQKRENTLFLPGIQLHENIEGTDSLTRATDRDVLLLCVPAQHIRSTLLSMKRDIKDHQILVLCAKGIEIDSGMLLSDVIKEILPNNPRAVLSGPTFASEIGRGLPSAVTIACEDKDTGIELCDLIGSRHLRTYRTSDIKGAQIGSAVKNVIAIAAGVIIGRGLGESARAALVTRGLAEMSRLASAMGAKKETLMGMCGMGDMILTCTSMQSRNYSLGIALGEGKTLDEILGARKSVTEGVTTAKALTVMARNHAVDMPIAMAVNECLNEGAGIDETIEKMLARPLRPESI